MKRRWVRILGAAFAVAIVAVAALLLFTDVFRTTVHITVENRTSDAVDVSVGDDGIGCGDSKSLAANTTARLKLTLRGVSVLCMGAKVYEVSVGNVGTSGSDERFCFWDEMGPARHLVITDHALDRTR